MAWVIEVLAKSILLLVGWDWIMLVGLPIPPSSVQTSHCRTRSRRRFKPPTEETIVLAMLLTVTPSSAKVPVAVVFSTSDRAEPMFTMAPTPGSPPPLLSPVAAIVIRAMLLVGIDGIKSAIAVDAGPFVAEAGVQLVDVVQLWLPALFQTFVADGVCPRRVPRVRAITTSPPKSTAL